MPRTSTPVAMGSSVPAWPTRRVPARRRIRATTSWDVHPAGLSTTRSPGGASLLRAADTTVCTFARPALAAPVSLASAVVVRVVVAVGVGVASVVGTLA